MNLYFLGILAALVVFFAVGIAAGRMPGQKMRVMRIASSTGLT